MKLSQFHALPVLLLACLGSAQADDLSLRAAEAPGTLGLTGFRDMVDGRTPSGLSLRGGLRYQVFVRDLDFSGAIKATRKEQRHEAVLYGGASLLGFVEGSIRLPFIVDYKETNLRGRIDPKDEDGDGVGDLDLAAKVSLSFGPLALAPYLFGRVPSGEKEVRDLGELEYGAAATIGFLNDHLAIHANLAGLQVEEGLSAVRYRLGISFVLWSEEDFSLRAYGYGDGIEFEGSADSDIDLEFGGQLTMGVLFFELGVSLRFLDANHLDETTRDALDDQGVFEKHFEDDGTWSVQLGAGVLF